MKQLRTFRPLLKKGTPDCSVICGAQEDFDLVEALNTATDIKAAIAFGHMSGWKFVSDSIKQAPAKSVDLLLGTAFFQTEPELLFELKNLSQSFPAIRVRLASPQATFHPKVWIVKGSNFSLGVVGSGNLTGGGLLRNVECAMYTDTSADVQALSEWFAYHWSIASELDLVLDEYVKLYEETKRARKSLDEKLSLSTGQFRSHEARIQLSWALKAAKDYWAEDSGKTAITERQAELGRMREKLRFPRFDFDGPAWIGFIKMSGFGWIRDGYSQKTILELDSLKNALALTVTDGYAGLDALMHIIGIGRNVATKLLAVCNSQEFVVCNSPVEAALRAFGIATHGLHSLNSQKYEQFMKDVEPFWRESDTLGLDRASALDAFFFQYRGTSTDRS